MHRSIIAGALALAVAATAWPAAVVAQADSNVGEIVVTASRRDSDDEGGGAAMRQPHVVLFHRADNLVVDLVVECDTRDESDRIAELKATLRNVVGAASADAIELGVQDEDAGVVVPFKLEGLDSMLSSGSRADTSRVSIVVKTRIREGDTFEAATGRIDAFIRKIKGVGRAQATRGDEWSLTLVSPRQYRTAVVAAIAKDAGETAAALGADYRVQLTGLERPIAWSRSGPLELALYIPYAMTVTPAPR